MGLKNDIESRVSEVIDDSYEITDARVTPSRESVTFGTTAKKFFARVLYIDLRGSQQLLSDHQHITVLKAHKAFVYAVAKCIRAEGGDPRSFNGDSVLAFWAGSRDAVAKKAVRAAMKTRYAIDEIINPKIESKYSDSLDFGIGIAQGDIYVGKSGVAGDADFQDLIWIGWPIYHAVRYGDKAKKPKAIWISKNIWASIKDDENMTIGGDEKEMWTYDDESFSFGTVRVYKTSYRWTFS